VGVGASQVLRTRRSLVRYKRRQLVTDPTSKPVGPDDVAGKWQFYLDDLSKTVTLRFHADGTYEQTMADLHGATTQCPGGTWTLSGPYVELAGYVSARRGTTESMRWRMIDTPSGLGLFGGDDPESPFAMTPVPPPAG
jgi:hypothetical protein